MNDPARIQKNLHDIKFRLQEVFKASSRLPGLETIPFAQWENALERLSGQGKEGPTRLAVVGPIKSGKSTLTNSLFGGDYLRRGAGVVTSIVTRIRAGDTPRAELLFKTWEEINAEIEDALVLLPSFSASRPERGVDIRLEADRKELSRALRELGPERLVSGDVRNTNAVLLSAYVSGFDKVRETVSDQPVTRIYEGEDFPGHKEYVGEENLAVYLKDVLLTLPGPEQWKDLVEIADCQGSDSPNPLHLLMIEDYLLATHFILYVVSSRTGLRQADIRFLSLLRRLGLLDNVLFVVNVDISEHRDLEDAKAVVSRVAGEIALIRPDPEVVAVSALYNLLASAGKDAPPKETARLKEWRKDKEFVEFLDAENEKLKSLLQTRLVDERRTLMAKNEAGRLKVMVDGAADWARANKDLLTRDRTRTEKCLARIRTEQKSLADIKSMARDALEGAIRKSRGSLGWDTDRFFDPAAGELLAGARQFVRRFAPETRANAERFSQAIYMVFQELRTSLDRHMVEVVHPMVAGFLKQKEQEIAELVQKTGEPYKNLIQDPSVRIRTALGEEADTSEPPPLVVDMEKVKRDHGVRPPALRTSLRYSTRIRTESLFRLGTYRAFQGLLRLMSKGGDTRDRATPRAMADAVNRMKKEILRSLGEQLLDFKENLKFQYLFPLLDMAAQDLVRQLEERFVAYTEGMDQSFSLLNAKDRDREEAARLLEGMEWDLREMRRKLDQVYRDLDASAEAPTKSGTPEQPLEQNPG